MLGGGRRRQRNGQRGLVCGHELDRAWQARKRDGSASGAAKVAPKPAVSVSVFVDVLEPNLGHHTPSQVLGESSRGSASNARSRELISEILRPSILTGAGILPSETRSS